MAKATPPPIKIINARVSASTKKIYEPHEITEEEFRKYGEYAFEAAVTSMGYKKVEQERAAKVSS